MVFEQTGPGEVSAVITVPEHFEGYPGVVHGGITAAMLDEAACRVYMNEDPPRFLFTARLEIRYRKNVPTQTPLRLVGKALKDRGRTVTAHSARHHSRSARASRSRRCLSSSSTCWRSLAIGVAPVSARTAVVLL